MLPRQLQDRIRHEIDSGRLPTDAPLSLEVRRGTGVVCSACGRRIRTVEIEHEFNYRGGLVFRLHFDCAALWMKLRRPRHSDEGPNASPHQNAS
jgi:hypothetical protein